MTVPSASYATPWKPVSGGLVTCRTCETIPLGSTTSTTVPSGSVTRAARVEPERAEPPGQLLHRLREGAPSTTGRLLRRSPTPGTVDIVLQDDVEVRVLVVQDGSPHRAVARELADEPQTDPLAVPACAAREVADQDEREAYPEAVEQAHAEL